MADTDALTANRAAERRLAEMIGLTPPRKQGSEVFEQHLPALFPASDLTLLLTPNEVNAAHGTGILAHRLLKEMSNVAVIRSSSNYDGSCLLDGLDVVLPQTVETRADLFRFAARLFKAGQIKQVICIPFHEKELILAIAMKTIYKCPFILYIMDDNCLYTDGGIPKSLMQEAMSVADVVLAISPEMQIEYQNEFREKLWIVPPVLDSRLMLPENYQVTEPRNPRHGVIVGNIWHQKMLDMLCDTLIGSDISVDWYCNSGSPSWLKLNRERLEQFGVNFCSPLPEDELVEILRDAPFALLPSSSLGEDDLMHNIGRLSLPSRVPFIAASAGTPIIVLGSKRTSAGAFVEHFGLGEAVNYDRQALIDAVERVTTQQFREQLFDSALLIGKVFDASGMARWLTEAAATGAAPDMRFETMLDYRRKADFGIYVAAKAPKAVLHDFRLVYEGLDRLKQTGFDPEFVLDVGASTGIWSQTVSQIFPNARYVLVDPLFDRYPQNAVRYFLGKIADVRQVNAAVSDAIGSMEMELSDNLYGSSLFGIGPNNAQATEKAVVPVTTLASIAQEHGLKQRGLLKIDVQFAEHLVIAGGMDFIKQSVDCIVIELTIKRAYPNVKTMLEILNLLDEMGFEWADQVGDWRSLVDGRQEQVDVLLLRKDGPRPAH